MATVKTLSVWMDHNNAHLMEFASDVNETNTVAPSFSDEAKNESLPKRISLVSNNHIHHYQPDYYDKLEHIIKDCEEVLLFGPAPAKTELYNILKGRHFFEKMKIEVKQTDNMTKHQQYTFANEYFSKQ